MRNLALVFTVLGILCGVSTASAGAGSAYACERWMTTPGVRVNIQAQILFCIYPVHPAKSGVVHGKATFTLETTRSQKLRLMVYAEGHDHYATMHATEPGWNVNGSVQSVRTLRRGKTITVHFQYQARRDYCIYSNAHTTDYKKQAYGPAQCPKGVYTS